MEKERDLKGLVRQMTLEEKAKFCSGLDFWHLQGLERLGIPSVMVTDGPHGLRKQKEGSDHLGLFDSVPATCFPSAAGLACSWDRALIHQVGEALGEECQTENVAVLLGPGANIKRSPLCGRNFEYFSEDPYLSSQMAANHIKGVQSQGVGTSLKHFAVNNQEHRRMSTSAEVSERTLREIYLASFEAAVKEGQPWTVMCSYNKVNGTFASENPFLLTDVLRKEWGFEGFVVSDWGAVNERVDGLKAGLDLEMPSSFGVGEKKIRDAIQAGSLDEATLDTAVERILNIVFKFVDQREVGATYDKDAHHSLARQVATECMVLLKNEEQVLPLSKKASVAVIGAFAEKARYQGGGSSHVNPTLLENAVEEIGKKAEGFVQFAKGFEVESDQTNDELLTEAKEMAQSSDVAVLFIGLPDRYESEGYDRTHLQIPANQIELIEAVHSVQENVVVVLSNGAPIEMPWLGHVKGVLEGYLGGQAFGGAVADLLYGDANPSGKLAETFPVKLSDNPSYLFFPGDGDRVDYNEEIFVGYRYYDTKAVEPLFPFGYGLSYTSFEYRNLVIDKKEANEDDLITVQVEIENTGTISGKEIVQLYVRDLESSVIRPVKELKGFTKVALDSGEKKTVRFELNKRAFAFYNTDLKDWNVESGEFEILIGKSSRDCVLSDRIYIENNRIQPLYVTRNTTIGDLLSHPIMGPATMKLMAEFSEQNPLMSAASEGAEGADMMAAMMKDMPLRAIVNFSGGALSEEKLTEIMDGLNALNPKTGNEVAQ